MDALSIPMDTLPKSGYIKGPKYRVSFDRIVTPRFTKEVDDIIENTTIRYPGKPDVVLDKGETISQIEEAMILSDGGQVLHEGQNVGLRSWSMDIRQVLTDNAIKDMMDEEDQRFLRMAKDMTR